MQFKMNVVRGINKVRQVVPILLPLAFATLLCSVPDLRAQTVTGQISGVVADPSGASVVGATILLTNELSKQVRTFKTDAEGSFIFPDLVPGDYDISISQAGFRTFLQNGINVTTQERVDLHTLRLQVGDVSSSVEVSADMAHVETDSSDRSVTVNTAQIDDTPSRGRNYLDILRSLPGTQQVQSNDTRGANANGAPALNGGQQGQVMATVDGIGNWLSGTTQTGGYAAPSVDAIGEMQVMVGNYSAEYGSRNGGVVNVTIKNGTNQFHGTVYNYMRNEEFNANEWFNDELAQAKPRYRYQNPGGTIGGPVLIPKTSFNRNRTRLFFFYSEDYLHNINTNALSKYTMPTSRERTGDFSQTVTSTGALIPILDPTTGKPLTGNILPQSEISPQGLAIMNLFPLPNTTDPTGQRQYNFTNQGTQSNPRDNRILRVDYSLGKNTAAYTRFIHDFSGNEGYGTTVGPTGAGWGQLSSYFDSRSWGLAETIVHTFSPNLVNELTWGINRGVQLGGPLDATQYAADQLPALKTPAGQPVTLPSLFPNANVGNLIPNISFATNGAQAPGQAVVNPPSFGWGTYWPFFSYDTFQNATNNISWKKDRHQFKFGAYFERVSLGAPGTASSAASMGQFWFGSDGANSNDTGYGFSNLLAGTVQSAQQDNARVTYFSAYNQYEWFAQDSWRPSRRLTFDLGVRFQLPGPVEAQGSIFGVFSASAYSASKVGQLLYPALVNGKKVAVNPVTQMTYPFARAASFDPLSYPSGGSPYSGMVQYKNSFFNWPHVGIGPHVGFAWDVFGDGKTAMRGGFGIVYGRPYTNQFAGTLAQAPPTFLSPQVFNTTFNTLLSTPGFLSPQNVLTGSPSYPNPSTYSWSFGVQRSLGKGFILDAAYTANVAHHMFGTNLNDINAVAPYTTWTPAAGINPKYVDPTNATGGLYNPNLIRALSGGYAGYGSIFQFTSKGESNYNALQVQINKRFGKQFQMGTNYTWSKTLVFSPQQFVPDELTKNVAAGNRPQVVNINFGYTLPAVSKLWKNFVTTEFLDGWKLNGVGSYYDGAPMTISCAASNVPANLGNYWTGTPASGAAIPFRCQMNSNLWLPAGATPASDGSTVNARLWYPFNAGQALSTGPGFVLPSATSLGIGNTPPTLTYGPGLESWDLSLSKQFPLGKETRVLEFRIDTFNTFNHFNPSNPNTSLTYNFVTGAQTNANFGAITSAQNQARHGSVSLRLRF